jgi:anti-anti-sigma factor
VRNVEPRTRACRGYAVVVLRGELDTRDAEVTAAAVAALAAGGQQLIIDLENLDFIDCHAFGALLGARETARQAGGDVLLAAPHGPVLRLLTLLGVPGVHASVATTDPTPGESGKNWRDHVRKCLRYSRGGSWYPQNRAASANSSGTQPGE